MERLGGLLFSRAGLQHIGEWHSHHRLGLAEPSGGETPSTSASPVAVNVASPDAKSMPFSLTDTGSTPAVSDGVRQRSSVLLTKLAATSTSPMRHVSPGE